MKIKTKLTLVIGVLVAMIVLLVSLSIVNLQILTATEPNSPAAGPGLQRALLWISTIGGLCIVIGIFMLAVLPSYFNKPIKKIIDGIKDIANHNYDCRLNLESHEFTEVSENFNRMAKRLADYHSSTLAQIKAAKNYMETIINSVKEPIIGLNNELTILFINDEALNVLNLKREEVLQKPAQDISLRNDLLRRLIRELMDSQKEDKVSKTEPLKIYADNKESYFQMKYMQINKSGNNSSGPINEGYVIMLKNITEFKELDSAKTTFISTISHELKTPISAIMMSLQLLEDSRIGDLNDEQIRAFRLVDNKASEYSSWDLEQLELELVELENVIDMSQFGFFDENDLDIKPEPKKEKMYEKMELKAFEHYDYLVFVFDNQMDFLNAAQRFGVHKVDAGYSKRKLGIGRVIKGAKLVEAIRDKDSDIVEGKSE